MVPLGLDQLYLFTKIALWDRKRILPVREGGRGGRLRLVVSIPKNSYGIRSGFYVAEPSRFGGLVPIEGPYRSRTMAAVAAAGL